jgi:hypothetical protein
MIFVTTLCDFLSSNLCIIADDSSVHLCAQLCVGIVRSLINGSANEARENKTTIALKCVTWDAATIDPARSAIFRQCALAAISSERLEIECAENIWFAGGGSAPTVIRSLKSPDNEDSQDISVLDTLFLAVSESQGAGRCL